MALSEAAIKRRINGLSRTIRSVNSANGNLGDLISSINDLKKLYGENVKIDETPPYQEHLDSALSDSKSIKDGCGRIVSGLYYRINLLKKEL